MATREIVQVGDPVLRRVAKPVEVADLDTPEMRQLIEDMRDTMRAAPGVGLAAPQIGVSLRLVVIEDPPEYQAKISAAELASRERDVVPFHVLVNPVVTFRTDEMVTAFEGCLSFAGFSMLVPRVRKVRIEALDETGAPFVKVAVGWYARILQHEVDHLDGTVCCDRMESRTLTTMPNLVTHWSGKSPAEITAALRRGDGDV